MGEPDIRKVFELAKHNELERLQRKVEYLENQIFVLEFDKTKATNHLLVLNRRIDEFQGTLNTCESRWARKTGEMGYMNQEPRMLEGPINYSADNFL